MKILTYKRTHSGDPDANGRFGIHDCMGEVRALHYDAVIGVGGIGQEARQWGIAGKINWVGIEPRKVTVAGMRGPLVTFKKYVYFGPGGAPLQFVAPALARRIYEGRVRVLLSNYTPLEQAEAEAIIRSIQTGRSRIYGKKVRDNDVAAPGVSARCEPKHGKAPCRRTKIARC